MKRIVSKYVRRAGIVKPDACKLFRHAPATLMRENRADIRVIQYMFGHADISTTQIYAYVGRTRLCPDPTHMPCARNKSIHSGATANRLA
ncbi:MAG: hypothetical protein C0631_03035 [Sedimenticola sp.]|nr:MAG: hypothetical protein C0631_03035 [Sedimenticola sp.]